MTTPARHPRAFEFWAGPIDGAVREVDPVANNWPKVVITTPINAKTPGEIIAVDVACYRYQPDRDRYEFAPTERTGA